jgi:hypothetical protein
MLRDTVGDGHLPIVRYRAERYDPISILKAVNLQAAKSGDGSRRSAFR